MAAGLRRAGPPGSFGVRLTVANTGGGILRCLFVFMWSISP